MFAIMVSQLLLSFVSFNNQDPHACNLALALVIHKAVIFFSLMTNNLCFSPLIYLICVQSSSQKERRRGKKNRYPTSQENWYVLSGSLYFNPCLYALTAFCGLFSMLPV
jgi:hypothetical protein